MDLDKVYYFNLKASFGDLSETQVNDILKDGRAASRFLEHQLVVWFPNLKYVDQAGYDHIDENGNKYDAKCWTDHGCTFRESVMIGRGTDAIDRQRILEHASGVTYILCDITQFPRVRVIFKDGKELAERWPRGQISKGPRNTDKVFSNNLNEFLQVVAAVSLIHFSYFLGLLDLSRWLSMGYV